jgi:hypothetical protein
VFKLARLFFRKSTGNDQRFASRVTRQDQPGQFKYKSLSRVGSSTHALQTRLTISNSPSIKRRTPLS